MCRSQGTNLIDDLVSLQDLDDAFGEFNTVALGEMRFFYAAEVTQFSMIFKMNPVATARFDEPVKVLFAWIMFPLEIAKSAIAGRSQKDYFSTAFFNCADIFHVLTDQGVYISRTVMG